MQGFQCSILRISLLLQHRSFSSNCSVRLKHWTPTQLKGRKVAEQNWLLRQSKDPYVRRAREESFRCRSAFKLLEIDDKHDFLQPGQIVIDVGAAPGSWSQVAVHRVNALHVDKAQPRGHVISVDISHMLRLDGATCLPFSDFTDEKVQQTILRHLNETVYQSSNNNLANAINSLGARNLQNDRKTLDNVEGNTATFNGSTVESSKLVSRFSDENLDRSNDSSENIVKLGTLSYSQNENEAELKTNAGIQTDINTVRDNNSNPLDQLRKTDDSSTAEKTTSSVSTEYTTTKNSTNSATSNSEKPSKINPTAQRRADVILSDMAPNATGMKSHDHQRIIQLSAAVIRFSMVALTEGGTCLIKVWRGSELDRLMAVMSKCFRSVKQVKPPSSRADSSELFILGIDFYL